MKIGMFTGGTIWILTHGHMFQPRPKPSWRPSDSPPFRDFKLHPFFLEAQRQRLARGFVGTGLGEPQQVCLCVFFERPFQGLVKREASRKESKFVIHTNMGVCCIHVPSKPSTTSDTSWACLRSPFEITTTWGGAASKLTAL